MGQGKRSRVVNAALRRRREAVLSPSGSGSMSRGELAAAVNEYIRATTGRAGALRREEVWRWESGHVRWPGKLYREALRAVLGAESDTDLGFVQSSRSRSMRPVGADESTEVDDPRADSSRSTPGLGLHGSDLTVQALIRHEGRVLMVRDGTTGALSLPGGRVQDGMPVQSSLRRHVAHQTGLEVAVIGFAGGVEHHRAEVDHVQHAIILVFGAHLADGHVTAERTIDDGVNQWVTLDVLARHDVRPAALRDALLERADGPFWRAWTK